MVKLSMTAGEEQVLYMKSKLQITIQSCRFTYCAKENCFFTLHLTETPTSFSTLHGGKKWRLLNLHDFSELSTGSHF